ncbi:MAG: hypothetical protein CTY25_05025 [Methylobacterium sp.]|nr:MAG: hypothetical protein CTY25_05025 [Methylobacterium sp.]
MTPDIRDMASSSAKAEPPTPASRQSPALTALVRAVDALAMGLAAMAGVALAAVALLIAGEMAARAVFAYSFSFAWEFSAYAVGIAIFGGLGWTLRTGGHIRVALLGSILPPGPARWAEALAALVGAALAILLAAALVTLCLASWRDGTRSFLGLETPLYLPQFFMALGAVGFALQAALRVVLLASGHPAERAGNGDTIAGGHA